MTGGCGPCQGRILIYFFKVPRELFLGIFYNSRDFHILDLQNLNQGWLRCRVLVDPRHSPLQLRTYGIKFYVFAKKGSWADK